MVRTVAVLLGTLIPAGLGAIFVWSTLNEILRGDASAARIVAGVVVLVIVLALLYFTYRYVENLEERP